jgi:hypothetical protein
MSTLMQRRTDQSDQRQRRTVLPLLQELRQSDPQVARRSCPVFGGVAAYHPRPSPSPVPAQEQTFLPSIGRNFRPVLAIASLNVRKERVDRRREVSSHLPCYPRSWEQPKAAGSCPVPPAVR